MFYSYLKDRQNGDGVRGRDDCPEVERVHEPDLKAPDELSESVHDDSDDEGGDCRAHEGEGHDGP